MTKLQELANLGQSIWLDDIRRAYLTSGELKRLVEQGVRGLTSNPTIFDKAIAGTADYDQEMRSLIKAGKSVDEIYETLALGDIRSAADALRPVYDQSGRLDGYVSLEVDPTLAHNTAETIAEANRLFNAVGRPNLMIKVPSTPAGVPAIETLIGQGININVTLIFSLSQYQDIAEAYMSGLENLEEKGGGLTRVASVASFFVSRVDTAVDRQLQSIGVTDLQGKIAVANAKLAYARFQEIVSSPRWQKLEAQGGQVQRPLWASTGTKNPSYSDTLYIDNLIGPHTVNTVPPATLQAFLEHGVAARTVDVGADQARAQVARLAELGINLEKVTQKLQDDGVEAFAQSFQSLMNSIAQKRQQLINDQ
jgi:transaldolase